MEVCDLCKGPCKPYAKLTAKVFGIKEGIGGEICQPCYDKLVALISTEYQTNPKPDAAPKTEKPKQLEEGINIVPPAKTLPVAANKVPAGCQHAGRQSFEPPNSIKCADCGETWQA